MTNILYETPLGYITLEQTGKSESYVIWINTEKHIISADARNADLIEFALRHPALTARIEQILGLHQAAPVKIAVAAYTVKIEALLSAYARRMASKAAPALPEPSPQPTTSGLKKRTSKARKAT